ncbi:hypothetical protein BJP25_11880 [Actinokineospora bangkokensis]|uniref:histidine kinase n=1 Tax=Actinokineospora bangkokensis TaxID=1193682 RepID=A0A1Q9LRV0_9PSEU|nr:hypothetical protein BJP25_11880 [Actinokineospora bangkokensis]
MRRVARRVGAQTAAVVAVAVALFAGVAVLSVLDSQHAAQDDSLAAATADPDDVSAPPAGIWLTTVTGTRTTSTPRTPPGLPLRADIDATAADGTTRTTDTRAGGVEYRVRTATRGSTVVQAALDLTTAHAERERLLRALAIAGAAGLVAATAVGVWSGRRAAAPLAEALAVQHRFLADAGHELRTPVTLISTRAQLLRRAVDRPRAALHADVDALVADAAALAAVLDDLLLAADPRQDDDRVPVDLGTVADRAIARLAAAHPGLSATRDDGVPATAVEAVVHGREQALDRAVTALLDNAARHAHSRVVVSVGRDGDHVEVTVTDDGAGIPDSALPHVFDRFSSTGSPVGEQRRYGLGLAIVADIAARHGGSVRARTSRSGALITLRLPTGRPRRASRGRTGRR